jgi:hypothetical protein
VDLGRLVSLALGKIKQAIKNFVIRTGSFGNGKEEREIIRVFDRRFDF